MSTIIDMNGFFLTEVLSSMLVDSRCFVLPVKFKIGELDGGVDMDLD